MHSRPGLARPRDADVQRPRQPSDSGQLAEQGEAQGEVDDNEALRVGCALSGVFLVRADGKADNGDGAADEGVDSEDGAGGYGEGGGVARGWGLREEGRGGEAVGIVDVVFIVIVDAGGGGAGNGVVGCHGLPGKGEGEGFGVCDGRKETRWEVLKVMNWNG